MCKYLWIFISLLLTSWSEHPTAQFINRWPGYPTASMNTEGNLTKSDYFLPKPVYGHVAAFICQGSGMLIHGGWPWSVEQPSDQASVLQMKQDSFQWKSYRQLNSPSPRQYHSLVATTDGQMGIMFGGYRTMEYLQDLYLFTMDGTCDSDPVVRWQPLQIVACADEKSGNCWPKKRAGHSAHLVPGSDINKNQLKMILFGGGSENGQVLNDVWLLTGSLNTNVWTWKEIKTTGEVIAPRMLAFSTVVGNRLAVFGGSVDNQGPMGDARLYFLDLTTEKWTVDAQYPASFLYAELQSGLWSGSGLSVSYQDDANFQIAFIGGFGSENVRNNILVYKQPPKNEGGPWSWLRNGLDIAPDNLVRFQSPTPRRAGTVVPWIDEYQNSWALYFGGTLDAPSNELNVLSVRNSNLDQMMVADQNLSGQLLWTSIQVDKILFIHSSHDASSKVSMVRINGWGFNDDEDPNTIYQNRVSLFHASSASMDGYVTLSKLDLSDVDKTYECVVSSSSFNQIECFTGLMPHGWYFVRVSIVDRSEGIIASGWARSSLCVDENYTELQFQGSDGSMSANQCIQTPVVTQFSPVRGNEGTVVSLRGGPFGQNVNDLTLKIGDSPCIMTSIENNGTSAKCIVGVGSYSGQVDVQGQLRLNTEMKQQDKTVQYNANVYVNFEPTVLFTYIPVIHKMQVASLDEQDDDTDESRNVHEKRTHQSLQFYLDGYGLDTDIYNVVFNVRWWVGTNTDPSTANNCALDENTPTHIICHIDDFSAQSTAATTDPSRNQDIQPVTIQVNIMNTAERTLLASSLPITVPFCGPGYYKRANASSANPSADPWTGDCSVAPDPFPIANKNGDTGLSASALAGTAAGAAIGTISLLAGVGIGYMLYKRRRNQCNQEKSGKKYETSDVEKGLKKEGSISEDSDDIPWYDVSRETLEDVTSDKNNDNNNGDSKDNDDNDSPDGADPACLESHVTLAIPDPNDQESPKN